MTQLNPTLLFENDGFLVVDKPAGWLSVPGRDPEAEVPVLSHWLRSNTSSQAAWVIHRLDRFTSGVMIFAKTEASQKEGNKWFEEKIVKKTYQFLASPTPSRPAIQIKTPVDGKPSQTLFEVLEKGAHAFLGKATPLTGRFHQVRDHAQVAGFPLLGDKAYKGLMNLRLNGEEMKIPRVCLHAAVLETPFGKFEAPIAIDMKMVWEKLK